jgi:hypothetical protein
MTKIRLLVVFGCLLTPSLALADKPQSVTWSASGEVILQRTMKDGVDRTGMPTTWISWRDPKGSIMDAKRLATLRRDANDRVLRGQARRAMRFVDAAKKTAHLLVQRGTTIGFVGPKLRFLLKPDGNARLSLGKRSYQGFFQVREKLYTAADVRYMIGELTKPKQLTPAGYERP